MIRVLSVFGTRPEAIKMAPVVRALAARPQDFESFVCVSAQHREMLDQVLRVFGIEADHDLDLMTPGQSPGDVVGRVLARLPPLLRELKPDVLLVQGDTMTAFAAALAAYLEKTPSGHVEAGLRTGDRYQPFPEEMNRILISRLASIHFAPTAQARDHLLGEGTPAPTVHVTGNTVIDALLQTVRPDYRFRHPVLAGLDPARRLVLITTHRRESFGAPLRATCEAIRQLACLFPDLEFVHLMNRATIILTDSGGIQEEAPSLGKPVLVLREVTERPEGVAAGTAVVVGTDPRRIVGTASELLSDRAAYERMAHQKNPYGDGQASERIATALLAAFG